MGLIKLSTILKFIDKKDFVSVIEKTAGKIAVDFYDKIKESAQKIKEKINIDPVIKNIEEGINNESIIKFIDKIFTLLKEQKITEYTIIKDENNNFFHKKIDTEVISLTNNNKPSIILIKDKMVFFEGIKDINYNDVIINNKEDFWDLIQATLLENIKTSTKEDIPAAPFNKFESLFS